MKSKNTTEKGTTDYGIDSKPEKIDKWEKTSKQKLLVLPDFDLSEGLCGQTDPELFFPEKGSSHNLAIKICEACSVKIECRDWAIENEEKYGIWGGMTANERKRLNAKKWSRKRGRPRNSSQPQNIGKDN